MPCPENDETQGEVTGFGGSPEGEFAYVKTTDYGPVTVLLNVESWRGCSGPKKGEIIMISGLTRYAKGWRALQARKFVLTDEQ